MSNQDDERVDGDILEAWRPEQPGDEFADQVLAARRAMGSEPIAAQPDMRLGRRPAVKWGAVVVVAGCAAILFLAVRGGPAFPGAAGELRADTRTSVRLAHRGVAVAETGADLSWSVARSGVASVNQKAGDVFYRVERGGAFAVDTPSGRVQVTGTCFRVEVGEMNVPKSGLIGAAVGAVLVVTVYEGSVLFADKSGDKRTANAGEKIVLDRSTADGPRIVRGPGSSDEAPAAWANPPADGISRADLLARDAEQRAALTEMKAKMDVLARDLATTRQQNRAGCPDDEDSAEADVDGAQ